VSYLEGLRRAQVLSGRCPYDGEVLLLEDEKYLIIGSWYDFICPKCERHYRIATDMFATSVQELRQR